MANFTLMPKLSDTMTVGTLVKWLKKEGDKTRWTSQSQWVPFGSSSSGAAWGSWHGANRWSQ
jgi:hypothetical protein